MDGVHESPMKMARFQTFWIQMQKNKPLNESCKTGQPSGTKMTFYLKKKPSKRTSHNFRGEYHCFGIHKCMSGMVQWYHCRTTTAIHNK
ncbi:hypothetical protein Hanom_Chr06g00554511 [Helianthus anomalus]